MLSSLSGLELRGDYRRVGGQCLGRGHASRQWLELRDAAGHLQDSVELEVRGAGARQQQGAPSSAPSARSR